MTLEEMQEEIRNTAEYKKRERFVISEVVRRLVPKGFDAKAVEQEVEDMVEKGELLRRDGGYISRSMSGRLISRKW